MSESDDVADWHRDYHARRERERQEAHQTFVTMCDRLIELGVHVVTLEYDGYGDSGSVEAVIAETNGNELELPSDVQRELMEAAETLLPDGWENNDGAFGNLTLDVEGRQLTREHNWRIESTEYEEESWTL